MALVWQLSKVCLRKWPIIAKRRSDVMTQTTNFKTETSKPEWRTTAFFKRVSLQYYKTTLKRNFTYISSISLRTCLCCLNLARPYIGEGGGQYIARVGKGAVAPARKTKYFFFSNKEFDFAGSFLVAILVRNLRKTDLLPPQPKKS